MWDHTAASRNANTAICKIFCLVAVAGLLHSQARADEFYLTTGKIVRGVITSQSDSQYIIQTQVGTMQLDKSNVVRTVSLGTTPVEIQGDIALKQGDYVKARSNYKQALNQTTTATVAGKRIIEKMRNLTSTTRQLQANQIQGRLRQASGLLQSRQYEAAAKILADLAPQVSENDALTSDIRQLQARIHYGKGMAALDAVKLDVARQEMEAAMAADPTFYPAYLSLGDSLLGNSATIQRGIDLIEQGLDAGGDRISEQQRYSYQYKLANKYFDQQNYAKAAATFAALIPAREKYAIYADALDRAVESYVRMGEENLSSDFRETIVNLNTALKLNPTNQKALFLLGRIYLDIGQIENAIVTLSRLVQLKANYPDANHYLGTAYFQAHDNEQALEHLTTEIESHPDNYFALVDRAEVRIATENYNGARADLAAAKALDDKHWLAYYLTGSLAFHENNYDEAQAALLEALDRKRTAVPVHLLMARVLVKQNQPDGARKWLEQVARELTNVKDLSYKYQVYLADANTQLGQIAIAGNSPRQAENYLKSALAVLPDYAPALVAMADTKLLLATDAYVSASRDQLYKEARDLYERALKVDPKNADYDLKMAAFYHHYQVDHEKAKKYYNLYVDKGGRNPHVNSWLAEVGGEARPEIKPVTNVAAGMVVTTATTTLTSGPLGSAMTYTTATATLPAGGIVLPVDAVMAETSPTLTLPGTVATTETVSLPVAQ